jgi:hypothetical protein
VCQQHFSVHPIPVNHFGECLVVGQEKGVESIPCGTAVDDQRNVGDCVLMGRKALLAAMCRAPTSVEELAQFTENDF